MSGGGDVAQQPERTSALAAGNPHPVDIHVGRRLRERRTVMGVSQETLAEAIGVSFQQVQKYERGANRISASRLWLAARLLGVAVDHFFVGLPGMDSDGDAEAPAGLRESGAGEGEDLIRRETLELARYFLRIDDAALSRPFRQMVARLAGRYRDGLSRPSKPGGEA